MASTVEFAGSKVQVSQVCFGAQGLWPRAPETVQASKICISPQAVACNNASYQGAKQNSALPHVTTSTPNQQQNATLKTINPKPTVKKGRQSREH